MKPNWESIIIHHSATDDDGLKDDWEGIRRFHMSWRLNGNTLTPENGRRLLAEGKPVIRPWRDIGYHFGIEVVKGAALLQQGRNLETPGAHCVGMNNNAIGICCVGNFDNYKPSDAVYTLCSELCARLIKNYAAIDPWKIYPHNKFSDKTCPGLMFDMDRLIKFVKIQICSER